MSNHSERRGSRDSLAAWFGGQIVSRGCDQLRGSGGPLPGSLMQQKAPVFHSIAMGFLLQSHKTEI